MNFAVLCANNNRAKCYIQNLSAAGHVPKEAIVLNNEGLLRPENTEADRLEIGQPHGRRFRSWEQVGVGFDEATHVLETLSIHDVATVQLNSTDVNSQAVIHAVRELSSDFVLYAGPGGSILGRRLLSQGKEFIHVHPGLLPSYRGSTTIYHSILVDGKIGCSVFLMRERIDQGPVLLRREYSVRNVEVDVDYVLDPCVRTRTLLDFFSDPTTYLSRRELYADGGGETFYIIHPVLKHIAVKKVKGNFDERRVAAAVRRQKTIDVVSGMKVLDEESCQER